jgi:colanic acid biosynthesis glycosyl transferase WcaI
VHVAFFNRSFYPDTTATGQLLTELCQGLVEAHGCRVSVVAGVPLLAAGGDEMPVRGLVQRERYSGVEILRARGTRLSKRRFVGRFTNYVSYFLSACHAGLRLERPDVVVAQTDPPIIGLAGYLAARRFGVPFVMAYKDIFPEVARLLEDFQSETVYRGLLAVNRFLARKADRVVALGETMRRRLIEGKGADPARTVVIHDWADCSAIAPGPKDNPFAREHGLAEKFVVMHSGNLGLSQGLESLVEAAAELRHVPDIAVVFVGEGVKKPALRERAERRGLGNVRFLPFTPTVRLHESFAAADVFVVSLKAGMAGYIVPSKLYGILAAGRPYVAAVEEASEVTAITQRWECGLVVPPGKAAEMADAVLKLYHDRPLALQMGISARRGALEFDRPRQVRAYYELFRELTGEARSRDSRAASHGPASRAAAAAPLDGAFDARSQRRTGGASPRDPG